MNELNRSIDNPVLQNGEIDMHEFFAVLWSGKIFILLVTALFAIGSVYYSLQQPNIYQATALLEVTEEQESNSSLAAMGGQFGGVASSFGISLPGGQSNKAAYVIETIKSKGFLKRIVQISSIKEKLFAIESYDLDKNTITFDETIFNFKEKKWVRIPPKGRKKEPSYIEVHDHIKDSFSVTQDKKTGFISISFQHQSPFFANEFVNLLIEEANNISREKDINESIKAIDYLNQELKNTEVRDVRQSINSLIEAQLKTLMLANIKDGYLIEPIDPSFIPEIKSFPNRKIICIIGTMFGMILSIILVLIRRYFFIYKYS